MKVKNLLFILFVLVIGLTSCNKESDLSSSIPVDAFYVVRLDANSLIKKSEYDVFKNSFIQQGVALGKSFLKDNEAKLFNSFLENANSLGIDLKGEYYIYMTDDKLGLILKVLDAKKLKESFDVLAKNGQIEFSNGIYSMNNSGSVVVWDDNRLIFSAKIDSYLDGKSSDSLLAETKNQLNLSEKKSINSNPQYRTFISDAKDISLYYAISKLQRFAQVQDNKQALEVLKEFDGVSVVSYQNFETGKIEITGKYLYDSAETEKKFKDFVAQFSSAIKGDQLKFVPEDPLFLATVNLQGQDINKYISKINSFNIADRKNIDQQVLNQFQNVLEYLDGDATLAISNIYIKNIDISDTLSVNRNDDYISFNEAESENLAIDFSLLGDVTNVDSLSNLFQQVTEKEPEIFEKISPNVYKLTKDPNNIVYFGLKGNLAFATTIGAVYQSIVNDKPLEKAYSANIKNKNTYISGDISKFNTSFIKKLGLNNNPYYDTEKVAKVLALLGLFNKFEVSVDADTYVMNGKIYLSNSEDNSLKTICKGIDQLISNLAPSMFF